MISCPMKKVILPPSIIGSPRYLHHNFQHTIPIAKDYHKSYFFITFTCNPQWPEITHSLLPNHQPQDRPDSQFHSLSKLCDKRAAFAELLLFLYMMDVGTLNLLHKHHLLVVLLVPKVPNGTKTPNLHTVCLCNMVILLKCPTNLKNKTNET